jgi:very-short-patch-repair endonuclease
VRPETDTAERKIARIAGRSHGIASKPELLAAGVTIGEIRQRLGVGALIPEYAGVYRVGHRAPSTQASYMAAVKACGAGSVLSGRAAAHHLGLTRGRPPEPEVTTTRHPRVPDLSIRRCRHLDPRDVTEVSRIPITTVPRTLVDLAAETAIDDLARLCHEAWVHYRTKPERIEAVLARRPNATGAANLRAVLRGEAKVTLSKLERRFLQLLRQHRLQLPQTNQRAGAHWVDCRWPHIRLTVELDSYRYHGSRHAWEADHRRAREAYARGDEFRRYSYADVFEDPAMMLAELRLLVPSVA